MRISETDLKEQKPFCKFLFNKVDKNVVRRFSADIINHHKILFNIKAQKAGGHLKTART